MRTLSVLFFTFRLLLISLIIYNFTRFLPPERRSRIRQRATLKGTLKIAQFCQHQGGIFLKAAQYMATVSNLFDAEYTEILAGVSDRVAMRPYEQIRYRFIEEFGVDADEIFTHFDRVPLAAASLGQVHVARIPDGRKVAVKLLHPDMESLIRRDLRGLRYTVHLILRVYSHLDFRGHLKEFANMILLEIDYENEAENIRRMRDDFKDDPRLVIPDIIEEYSRSSILTTEFIEGIPINNLEKMDELRVNRVAVSELLMEAYMKMVFKNRFFHADPHPGNIFVIASDPATPVRLGFVDFGAAQDVSERTIFLLQRFIEIMRLRDIPALVDLTMESGMLRQESDREAYINLFEIIHARYASFKVDDYYRINPVRFGRMIKVRDLNALDLRIRDMIADFRFPRKYIYLARTLTILLSLAFNLDDRMNVFIIARPYLEKYMGRPVGGIFRLIRNRNWSALSAIISQASSRRPMGREIQKESRVTSQSYYRLGQQVILGATGISFSVIATILLLNDFQDYARVALFCAGFAYIVLLLKMWKNSAE